MLDKCVLLISDQKLGNLIIDLLGFVGGGQRAIFSYGICSSKTAKKFLLSSLLSII